MFNITVDMGQCVADLLLTDGWLTLTSTSHASSLALASLNKHTEAVGYYKKALELDPENDTYKSNLKIAEQKMETPSPVSW